MKHACSIASGDNINFIGANKIELLKSKLSYKPGPSLILFTPLNLKF